MNDYEKRQEARRERLESRAAAATTESNRRYSNSRAATAHIPMGQPILVGHHSEGRHRAALKRSDDNMRASIKASENAERLKQQAAAVGTGGISSDDPEAVTKLQAALNARQRKQDLMRAVNKALRSGKKGGTEAQVTAIAAVYESFGMGKSDEERRLLAAGMLKPDFVGRVGYANYELSNNNAEIRRLTERIAQLKQASTREDKEFQGVGYTCREDVAENRVMFVFDRKPEPAIRDVLKRHSFKWSPTREAWVRQLTNSARYDAAEVRKQLAAMAEGSGSPSA